MNQCLYGLRLYVSVGDAYEGLHCPLSGVPRKNSSYNSPITKEDAQQGPPKDRPF